MVKLEPRRLVLHFNTCKTVWTCDLDNNNDTEFLLQEALCETSWGTLNSETNEWELSDDDRGTLKPADDSLVSYLQYLKQRYPIEGDHLDMSTVEEHRRQVRIKTQEFTNKHYGQKLRPLFEQMVKNLSLPKAVLKAYGINKVVLNETDVPENPMSAHDVNSARFGRNRLVPSFLTFVTHLVQKGRNFQVVFRGLGSELDDVVKEWNMYCEGKHPAFCGQNKTKRVLLNGEKDSRDMRVKEESVGGIDRLSQFLEFPTRNSAEPGGGEDLGMFIPTKYPLFHGIYAGILEMTLEGTVAIKDDEEFYATNDKVPESSKLMLVDFGETKIHHIFFDGTLGASASDSTVDVREVVRGEEIPYEDSIGVNIFRVNFVQAIIDPDYYITALAELENNFQARIERFRLVELDVARHARRGSATAMQEGGAPVSSKLFINSNIIPALLPALEICARDRPDDPLEFIAFYMLRHKFQYNKAITVVDPRPSTHAS
eukprot:GEMP01027298.1.p1 GENE.GEMP01027298.1~~GEMP01027298.1.p1  ORF type:complete len:486 (+),score=119.64 GEMP01027298.1:58-1515(+)